MVTRDGVAPPFSAVLFDMDGVLVDSEPFICRAAVAMFERLGQIVEPADFLPFVGAGEDRYLGGVAEKYAISLDLPTAKAETYRIYGEIIQGRLVALPGVSAFIEACRASGLRTAVATSADHVKMRANLTAIGIRERAFDAVVTGEDVNLKKPHPDIYLEAARRVGVPPAACLVVEDAVNGIAAARAAGMRCLALETSFDRSALVGADWVCADLSAVPESLTAVLFRR